MTNLYGDVRGVYGLGKSSVCGSPIQVSDRDGVIDAMTTPTVTELPRRREPVSADTFLGDLALGEQRLFGDARTALGAPRELPSCQLELFASGAGLQECF
jgi:hypothetical protein